MDAGSTENPLPDEGTRAENPFAGIPLRQHIDESPAAVEDRGDIAKAQAPLAKRPHEIEDSHMGRRDPRRVQGRDGIA